MAQQLLHHTSLAHRLLHMTVANISGRLHLQQTHICATHVPVAALPHSHSCSAQALDERLCCCACIATILMYMYAPAQDKQHCQCILAVLHAVSSARPWRCTTATTTSQTNPAPSAMNHAHNTHPCMALLHACTNTETLHCPGPHRGSLCYR